MYRPPEMLDSYQGYNVGLKVDLWMLGCVLYALCFEHHPFQESQSLAILNAQYTFPDEAEHISAKMRDLIRSLLTPDPEERPSIWQLEATLSDYEALTEIQLGPEALQIKRRQEEAASSRIKKKAPQPQQPVVKKKKKPSFSDSEGEEEGGWDKPEESEAPVHKLEPLNPFDGIEEPTAKLDKQPQPSSWVP